MRRNSVLEGFTDRRLAVSQWWVRSKVEVSSSRDFVTSAAENEIELSVVSIEMWRDRGLRKTRCKGSSI